MSGVERDRIVATLCTVASYLLAWLLWLRFAALPAPEAAADPPLRLVWIDPPAADVTPALPPPVASRTPQVTAPSSRPATPQLQWVAPPSPAETTPPAISDAPSSLDADAMLRQARDWASAQAPSRDYRRNPLDRPAPFDEARPKRFRERPPPSPADVVSAIGEFFGGPGYGAGPCPRIRSNIARLSTGGDSERLQEELRREREACRP